MIVILFKSLFPVVWVVITSVALLCLLGWLEVKRNQKFLSARLLSLVLAILSVVCLITNPVLSTTKVSDCIVLTPHYSKDILDSLLKITTGIQVYKLPGVTGINNAVEIKNYRHLNNLNGNLFILGEGIPQYMLEYADTSSLQYFPSPVPGGFTGIDATKTYTATQRGALRGIVNAEAHMTLTLTGPGISEDSIHINTRNSQPFALRFTPKTAGLFLYTLSASDSLGAIQYTEPVPVQVKAQNALSILFLSDYPSAEIRFLKNFLEKENHKLVLRYKISKDKYRTEFINTSQKKLGQLNKSLLHSFDLVITDASSLNTLGHTEIQALKNAMHDGLGMITLIDTSTLPKNVNEILNLKLGKVKGDSAQVLINAHPLRIPAAPVSAASAQRLFPILRDASGRIVSGYTYMGLGKGGFQLLTNTFSLSLIGEKEAYAAIWSPLLEAVARKEIIEYDLSFTSPFPYYPAEPVEFKIISGGEKPTVSMDSSEISLLEDPLVKNVWYGKIWAPQSGWNSLHIEQDSSEHNFFVSHPDQWKSLRVANQQKNLRTISSLPHRRTADQTHDRPVPRIFFLLTFLLSAGFLWLAPKLG